MNARVSDLSDFGSLETLRMAAAKRDPEATKKTATKFESVFAEQLVKSMRQASFGDSMFPGESQTYREMYDHELATQLTRGRGLGLAPIIQRALGQTPEKAAALGAVTRTSHAISLAHYTRALPPQRPIATDNGRTILPPGAVPVAPLALPVTRAPAPSPAISARAATPVASAAIAAPTNVHSSTNRAMSPEAFVASVWPHAQRAAAELGVSPKALVAQAALETGWGKSVGGAHNLFGIKASQGWHGAQVDLPTSEFANGSFHRETASFRSYASVGDSFDDYVRLLKSNPRYAAALGTADATGFAHAMQKAGYATDPAYAAKIASIANSPVFDQALQNARDVPILASR